MASSDSSTSVHFPSYSPTSKERRATWSGNDGRPAELDRLAKLETPHTFVIHCYKSPTICAVCRKLVSFSQKILVFFSWWGYNQKTFVRSGLTIRDKLINVNFEQFSRQEPANWLNVFVCFECVGA